MDIFEQGQNFRSCLLESDAWTDEGDCTGRQRSNESAHESVLRQNSGKGEACQGIHESVGVLNNRQGRTSQTE